MCAVHAVVDFVPEWLGEGRSARCSMVCMPSHGVHVTSGVPKGGVWASEGGFINMQR